MDNERLATRIANRLAGDAVIISIAEDRVLDRDYRETGWNKAPVSVFDEDGIPLPTVMVVDGGAMKPFEGPRQAVDETIYVWGFSVGSDQGFSDVAQIMKAVRRMLDTWQDPVTKAVLLWTGRTGSVLADDGVFDRHTFRVSGIPKLD